MDLIELIKNATMKNADCPAFPTQRQVVVKTSHGYADTGITKISGFTKREAIAKDVAASLAPGWLAIDSVTGKTIGIDNLVKVSIELTDELLKQLNPNTP